jgi:hypothetical protein
MLLKKIAIKSKQSKKQLIIKKQIKKIKMQNKNQTNYTKRGKLAKEFCNLNLPLQVLQSNAGYYLGTMDEEGPVSRESEYFPNFLAAETALKNNTWCQRETP